MGVLPNSYNTFMVVSRKIPEVLIKIKMVNSLEH